MIARVPLAAVDTIQRVALVVAELVVLNYPAWQVERPEGWVGAALEEATHAGWDDHRLTKADVALVEAIGADPTRVPLEGATRVALLVLYPEATVEMTP